MKIGIIGAMDYEVTLLLEAMVGVRHIVIAGSTFHSGQIAGRDTVVVESGIGKVNAALCAQILISEFKVTHVINTGVAGAIYGHLEPGDVVISTDLAYHDMDVTAFGDYQPGDIPRMEESYFEADSQLKQLAQMAVAKQLGDHAIYQARIVSGDQFVASEALKDAILEQFNAAATEMEGAAIGHVCHLNKIPFVVIRAISDKADGSAQVNFETFARDAAKTSAKSVIDIIGQL